MTPHRAFTLAAPLPLIPFAVLILILAVIGHHATQARGSCGDPAGRGTTSGRDGHVDAEQMAVASRSSPPSGPSDRP